MPRVQFTVSYAIPDGKRADYLSLVKKLRSFYGGTDVEYAVCEVQSAHNHFREVFRYASMEAFDASDDPDATKEIADVIDAVYEMATGISYETCVEVG